MSFHWYQQDGKVLSFCPTEPYTGLDRVIDQYQDYCSKKKDELGMSPLVREDYFKSVIRTIGLNSSKHGESWTLEEAIINLSLSSRH
eukprot:scaffold1888_cov120-Cylindrotheca_fusiformis.AAC.28